MFDFTGGLVPAGTTEQLSFRMSDHFPLWVEFDV
jgi:endonuclease/exonuclease/phosphatase (EEP) superfamily protein YafD